MKKKLLKNINKNTVIFLTMVFLLSAGQAKAATVTAKSCNTTDVQAAITAAANGDTISIPAGACTWSTTIKIGSDVSRPKMVKFIGSGSGNNPSVDTIITCNTTAFTMWLSHTIAPLEIAKIRFIQNYSGEPWAIQLSGHADTEASLFRIHDCHFQYSGVNTANAIIIGQANSYGTPEAGHPYIWGLLDNNTFKAPMTVQGIDIGPRYSNDQTYSSAFGGGSMMNDGHEAWKLVDSNNIDKTGHQGTWRNVILEDNLIDCRPGWTDSTAFMDSNAGAAYVFRHNVIYNAWVGTHDPGSSQVRGSKWTEVYGNKFILDHIGDGYAGAVNIRSGSGVVYDNEFYDTGRRGSCVYGSDPYCLSNNKYVSDAATDTAELHMQLEYYRSCYLDGGFSTGEKCQNNIRCGEDTIAGCDNEISNAHGGGWICRDGVGAKKGAADATKVYGYKWETEPLVEWNNNYVGALGFTVHDWGSSGEYAGCAADYTQERRDYINHNSCAGHMGEAICSTFWDDVNNKKKGYVAYTYPHPLAGGTVTCATADANCDGSINISDVQVCINVILGTDTDINHQSRCDLNGGGVNITDVQAVINKILNP